ncbi:erg26, C-3 sterol dehydrogenase, partial [Tulasnella sp. 403]
MATQLPQSYLVIGGSGFLGRHVVEGLLKRGEKNVSTFDIVQRYHDVPHYTGDITDGEQLGEVLRKAQVTTIFHTASPIHNLSPDIYYKVNVVGTLAVVKAAMANHVSCLVYTSSSGVVDAGIKLIDADERLPFPENFVDAYNESKALAERIVLEANGRSGLLTVALRPSGIFGPGDRQVTTGFAKVILNKQTHFQIGDNQNIFDMTYIDNVVHAHLLGADRLAECCRIPPSEWQLPKSTLAESSLEYSARTVGNWHIPTSESKPLGPIGTRTPSKAELDAEREFRSPDYTTNKPVTRTKFDPLSDPGMEIESMLASAQVDSPSEKPTNGHTEPADSPFLPDEVTYTTEGTSLPHPASVIRPNLLQIPGQAFFITNGEPVYFWDFGRMMWKEMGVITQ